MEEYTIEEMMRYNNYRELCECFLKLAKDAETEAKLKEILYNGKVGNYTFASQTMHKDSVLIESGRRVSLAFLLLNDPETFTYFVQNNIKVFHGTNANALPNILKYGLQSLNASREKGIPVLTGEEWNQNKNVVRFSDVLDVARNYAACTGETNDSELSFPVIVGTNDEAIETLKKARVHSDFPEFGIDGFLPKAAIKCICVPEDKVDFVKMMVGDDNIAVLGMSNYKKKFYAYDDSFLLMFFPGLYAKFQQQDKNEKKKFSMSELVSLVKSRSAIKMRNFISQIKGQKEASLNEDEVQTNGRNL